MVTRGHTSEVLDYALYCLVTRRLHVGHTWVTRQIKILSERSYMGATLYSFDLHISDFQPLNYLLLCYYIA